MLVEWTVYRQAVSEMDNIIQNIDNIIKNIENIIQNIDNIIQNDQNDSAESFLVKTEGKWRNFAKLNQREAEHHN